MLEELSNLKKKWFNFPRFPRGPTSRKADDTCIILWCHAAVSTANELNLLGPKQRCLIMKRTKGQSFSTGTMDVIYAVS